MSVQWLTFLHLAGAFLFVGGSILAAVLRVTAMRRHSPGEIALLLGAVRPAVPVVAGGLVLTVGVGFWLADRLGYDLGGTWLSLTFALVAWMLVVGALAGRQDRHTRELAERLAREGDVRSAELAARLRDPLNLALNASMLAAVVAVVALMVWKPGA
jgi:uncharacterized membrane protein